MSLFNYVVAGSALANLDAVNQEVEDVRVGSASLHVEPETNDFTVSGGPQVLEFLNCAQTTLTTVASSTDMVLGK